MLPVHDNRIHSYTVDGQQRLITLRSVSEAGDLVDIEFSGVEAYSFRHDNFGNIILSIREAPISQVLEKNEAELREGERWGWPGPWNTSAEARAQHFEAAGVRAYELKSSFGMVGWVISTSLSIQRAA